ncbi:hypothetical protein [Oricola thermophila]|uniref:Uncharacterized protein n=1 Tax=Oricola thermophila TaxID=2742145 RepID=A0A6N1VDT7_9HYPH|nr:hypothetical protein [Oricola thermophila]QKV18703.1 hypothetical protein HTY61_09705 [Oricola thermophila]
MSTMFLPAACATDSARYLAAAASQADASVAVSAAGDADDLPPLPADCRRRERSGVVVGDRLDAAALKSDGALGRANDRVIRCAAWYDALRAARSNGESS